MVASEDSTWTNPAAGDHQHGAAAALSALCGSNLRYATDLAYVIRAQALRNREVAEWLPRAITATHETIPPALGINDGQAQADDLSELGGMTRLVQFGLSDRDVDWIAHVTGLSRRQTEPPDDPLFLARHQYGCGMTGEEQEVAVEGIAVLTAAAQHERHHDIANLRPMSSLGRALMRMMVRRLRADVDSTSTRTGQTTAAPTRAGGHAVDAAAATRGERAEHAHAPTSWGQSAHGAPAHLNSGGSTIPMEVDAGHPADLAHDLGHRRSDRPRIGVTDGLADRAGQVTRAIQNEIACVRQATANRTLQNYTWSGYLAPFLWLSAVEAAREALRLSLRTAGSPLNGFRATVEWWEGRDVMTSGDALECGYLHALLQEHLANLADPHGWAQGRENRPHRRDLHRPDAWTPRSTAAHADHRTLTGSSVRILPRHIPYQPERRTVLTIHDIASALDRRDQTDENANAPPAALRDDGSVDGAAAQRAHDMLRGIPSPGANQSQWLSAVMWLILRPHYRSLLRPLLVGRQIYGGPFDVVARWLRRAAVLSPAQLVSFASVATGMPAEAFPAY
ncbi:unnamed protein product [Prorocentrum cordatum]|uniref:Uncharacterized protein n=1 Tax=Prorocentrum cordatum TaxID=2364126 RepID=A0ABN9PH78_9DINO|nr:unnamed protein product [Polarella glacialis]